MGFSVKTRSFIGKGKWYLRNRSGGPSRFIGNVSAASFTMELDTKREPDFTAAGGGSLNELERVTSMSGEMTTYNHSPDNLALLLRGHTKEIAAGAVTGEAHVAYLGAFVRFDYIRDPGVAVVVKKGASTISAATNYAISGNGILILDDAADLIDEDEITIDYTRHVSVEIHALTTAGEEWELYFDGLNEADSGNPCPILVRRSTFSPTDGMELISDEFGQLKMGFSCLKDTSITASDESAFVVFQMVETAAEA